MASSFRRCDWLALWLALSTWCTLSGWALSALNLLNRAGYAGALVLFAATIAVLRREFSLPTRRPPVPFRLSPYRHGWAPRLWAALALLSLLGGLLYHPDDFDYLTYRFPRVLHWAWAHHWFWIDTMNHRMNLSAPGFEWLMAPLFIFSRTDRLFFLINAVSYLFLPGLIYSVFRHLGVRGRIAWWWMWILPAGFCYIIQAGGTGNDMFAAVYFLAAIYYAFQTRPGSPRPLILSVLAIALVTGSKASNLPLAAPWLVILVSRWQTLELRRHFFVLAAATAVAALVSFVPIAVLNLRNTGDYAGDPGNSGQMKLHAPLAGVIGNSMEIVAANVAPPIWYREIPWRILPTGISTYLTRKYPRYDPSTAPFQIEENAAAGLGIFVAALVAVIYGISGRSRPWRHVTPRRPQLFWFVGATLVAWFAYLTQMGSEAAPRLVTTYYIPALGCLLACLPLDGAVVHRPWWKIAGLGAILLPFPLIILNPGRPLLPSTFFVAGLRAAHLPEAVVSRLDLTMHARGIRRDDLAELRRQLPASEKVVGYLDSGDDPEVSAWLPFGSREVIDLQPDSSLRLLHQRQIHFAFVSQAALSNKYGVTLLGVLKKWDMSVASHEEITVKIRRGVDTWYLLRSNSMDPSPSPSISSP